MTSTRANTRAVQRRTWPMQRGWSGRKRDTIRVGQKLAQTPRKPTFSVGQTSPQEMERGCGQKRVGGSRNCLVFAATTIQRSSLPKREREGRAWSLSYKYSTTSWFRKTEIT
eukprot:scaffold3023_cov175-Amphora_coffeaeformis.AAC.14